jgi:hypothetical protein
LICTVILPQKINTMHINTVMKTLNEWMTERESKNLPRNDFGCQTEYDNELVQTQVADWITKLVGLCSNVPPKKRKEFTEAIVKEVRSRMLKG